MHLGNSIVCPVTGMTMLAIAGLNVYMAYKTAKKDFKKENIMFAIVMTIFVFAMQMINFSIPQTGSSGHIIGAVLLAALLGPSCAYLAICTILLVQAVFFADGGLLALGCNIFNMGFLACSVVYPLIYKPLAERKRFISASVLASVAALQLGSLAVVAEGIISGSITGNPANFLGLMQFIHLPIGIIEGLFTAGIVILANKTAFSKKLTYIIGGISLVLAGFIAQFASSKPDGLEWSLLNISDSFTGLTEGIIYSISTVLQSKLAILSTLNSTFANLAGICIVAVLMMIICKRLSYNTVKINDK